jgi:LmbE family N-acetylglucosaminyl deacetylase
MTTESAQFIRNPVSAEPPNRQKVGTVIVSPHSDDAAFSVGGSILSGFFPAPLLIVTPFAISITAPYFSGKHDAATISRLRREEDESFARTVNSRIVRLALPEATLSNKTGSRFSSLIQSSSLLCGWPPPRNRIERNIELFAARTPLTLRYEFLQGVARFDRLRSALRDEIIPFLSPEVTLVSPLGLGYHPNHILLSSLCKTLRSKVSNLYFYEDLPFGARYTLREIERHIALFDRRLRPVAVDIERVMNAKLDNLSIYRSQVKSDELARVMAHAERLSSRGRLQERLWTYPRGMFVRPVQPVHYL